MVSTLVQQYAINFFSLPCNYIRYFLDSDHLCVWTHLISTVIPILSFTMTKSCVLEATATCVSKQSRVNWRRFNPKDSKLSATTNLHPVPQNLFRAEAARDGPIRTVILQMLFQIFPSEFLTAILRAQHVNKTTLLQVILRKEEQFLKHWTFPNMNLHRLSHT